MKTNSPLFAVKERSAVKSENLVDNLYSTYEHNFTIIEQMLLSPLENQTKFKISPEPHMHLLLSSNHLLPDIHVEMNFLSPYTVDVEMYYGEHDYENIRYVYNVKFRLFLDAKILEVKETGLCRSSGGEIQESDKEASKKSGNSNSVQNKLTKNLLVHEWFNKLIVLEYTFNKIQ